MMGRTMGQRRMLRAGSEECPPAGQAVVAAAAVGETAREEAETAVVCARAHRAIKEMGLRFNKS